MSRQLLAGVLVLALVAPSALAAPKKKKDAPPPPPVPAETAPVPPVPPVQAFPMQRPLPAAPPSVEIPRAAARPDLRSAPFTRPQVESHSEVTRERVAPVAVPERATRSFDATASPERDRREHADREHPDREHPDRGDHRYVRPSTRYVPASPLAGEPPPAAWSYQPWYAHWWVHPYYRHYHETWVVVTFPFETYAWSTWWVPPARPGWIWVPGYWSWGRWVPGYWVPVGPPPGAYVYVPGWWQGDVYVDGFWRVSARPDDDWVWVDGYYLEDGTYVRGHWRPAGPGPEGYVWEPGFFDGARWVDGFWRPEYRVGFVWISSYFDAHGVYHAGYWEPVRDRPGSVWVPGWFDGTRWVEGYWVTEEEYRRVEREPFAPPAALDEPGEPPADARTLALPVSP